MDPRRLKKPPNYGQPKVGSRHTREPRHTGRGCLVGDVTYSALCSMLSAGSIGSNHDLTPAKPVEGYTPATPTPAFAAHPIPAVGSLRPCQVERRNIARRVNASAARWLLIIDHSHGVTRRRSARGYLRGGGTFHQQCMMLFALRVQVVDTSATKVSLQCAATKETSAVPQAFMSHAEQSRV